jgi:hypothetical protein
LKRADPNLSIAYLRTDNAGCYKGSETLLAVEEIYNNTGVLIHRIDFTDAQSGKVPCDRMASVAKANIRRFVNEKNDFITSSNFVDAAKSTRFMTVMACRLFDAALTNKITWSGVQNLNNISYEWVPNEPDDPSTTIDMGMKITVWRAIDVGPDQVFDSSKLGTIKDIISSFEIGAHHDNPDWQIYA